MATSVARKAALPAGATLVQAWALGGMPPRLCAPRGEPAVEPVVHLPCENGAVGPADAAQQHCSSRSKPVKSFEMHIGGALHIPSKNAQERPQPEQPAPRSAQAAAIDPFEGLPFRNFAERLGERILPSLEAAREAEKRARLANHKAGDVVEVFVPPVPHLLPITRWAASSTSFRSTFIADPPKQRKKARMSWYHPDDTMVPRDWFRAGLLADLKYYMPFGLGGGAAEEAAPGPQ